MKNTLYPLGLALALVLGGCAPSADAPPTPVATATPGTTSQRMIDDEVASVDLSRGEQKNEVASRDSAPAIGSSQMGIQIQALEGHLAEQQMAELALERASDPEVREAARMIDSDHERAETELRQAAGSTLPDTMNLNSDHQQTMTKLRALSGSEFDIAYLSAMVVDHEKSLAFYQKQARQAPTEELRSYFGATSEVIARHLDHCRELRSRMS